MRARFVVAVVVLAAVGANVHAEEKQGYIGVQVKKHHDDKGATVQAVIDDGPAAKAGLKADDVITKIDGKEFETLEEFVQKVRSSKPGDKIKLTVMRDGKEKEIEVTAGEAPKSS